MTNQFRHRLCLIGDLGCGKTCLARHFAGKPFTSFYRFTIGTTMTAILFPTKEQPDKDTVRVWLDDTSGEERYRTSITAAFVRHARCVLLCFDLSCPISFEAVKSRWLPWSLDEACSTARHVLVGLKADLKTQATLSKVAKRWAGFNGMDYFETSAKTGEGTDSLARYIGSYFKNEQMLCMSMSLSDASVSLPSMAADNESPTSQKKRHRACCSSQ